MSQQKKQQRTKYTALGGSCAQCGDAGKSITYPNCLRSLREGVQDSVAEGFRVLSHLVALHGLQLSLID